MALPHSKGLSLRLWSGGKNTVSPVDAQWVMKGEKSADWLPVPCRYIHDKIYGMALDNTGNYLQA